MSGRGVVDVAHPEEPQVIRAKFTKGAGREFISHLDLARTWERALRRAGIRMAFSEGFNPHPKISFASALAVGVQSCGEYMDVEVAEPVPVDDFVSRTNACLPQGIRVLEARPAPAEGRSLMAGINAAVYQWEPGRYPEELSPDAIEAFLSSGPHQVTRERRGKKPRTFDVVPMVNQLKPVPEGEPWRALGLILQVGSQGTLRPEELFDALGRFIDKDITFSFKDLVRLDLLYWKAGNLVSAWLV